MFRSSAGIAFGMLTATASAGAGVLILVAPYVTLGVALLAALVVMLPLVVLWRSLAAAEAALPAPGRLQHASSDRGRPPAAA